MPKYFNTLIIIVIFLWFSLFCFYHISLRLPSESLKLIGSVMSSATFDLITRVRLPSFSIPTVALLYLHWAQGFSLWFLTHNAPHFALGLKLRVRGSGRVRIRGRSRVGVNDRSWGDRIMSVLVMVKKL